MSGRRQPHVHGLRVPGPRPGQAVRETTALAGVDLAARPGTVLGVLGPNGAGKTTAVRILATLLRPDAGTGRGRRARRRHATPPGAPHDRADRAVRLGGRGPDRHREPGPHRPAARPARGDAKARAAELLAEFDLTEAGRPAGQDLLRRHAPPPRPGREPRRPARDVIFLDEPTTGLDPAKREDVWNMVRAHGRATAPRCC